MSFTKPALAVFFALAAPALIRAQTPAQTTGTTPASVKTVTFPTADGVTITADAYDAGRPGAPCILLCHQAGYSRGEYAEIAPKLAAMGFSSLAIDQRSGKTYGGVDNATFASAKGLGKGTEWPDAYPDVEAALAWIKATCKPGKLIVWGSSYSASLMFILASRHGSEVDAMLAFSPGEYFTFEGKPIADYAKKVTCPVFITSAKSELDDWKAIGDAVASTQKILFVPTGSGTHGAKTLHARFKDHPEYWKAVETFLAPFKNGR